MSSEQEILTISDDESDDNWNGFLPRIVSAKSVSSSESGFSGFNVKKSVSGVLNRRLYDDLEIVEEVIRDVMPGSAKQNGSDTEPIHYRKRKIGFHRMNIKKENALSWDDLPQESLFDIDDNLKSPSLINTTDIDNSNQDLPVDTQNPLKATPTKRLFAAMRTLFSNSVQKKKQRVDSPLPSREEEEEQEEEQQQLPQSPSPSVYSSITALEDSGNELPFEENSVNISNKDSPKHQQKENSKRKVTSNRDGASVKGKHIQKKSEKSSVNNLDIDNDSSNSNGRLTPAKSDEIDEDSAKEDTGDLRHSKRLSNIVMNINYGRYVWGKTGCSRPWPAVIVSPEACGEKKPQEDKAWLLWFGDYRITQVPLSKIQDFVQHFKSTYVKIPNQRYNDAIYECLKECREQCGLEPFDHKKAYLRWGENGMTGFYRKIDNKDWCSPKVERCLSRIRKMRLREKSSSEASFFPTSTSSNNSDDSCADERNAWKPKASLINAVRQGKQDIEKICISCDRTKCEVVAPHPYFHGGTCSACKEELEDLSSFVFDGTSMYCLVCGSPGELIVCDEEQCEKVFCTGCIELLVSPKVVKEILDTDPWLCFLCKPYVSATHGLLKPRPDWQKTVASIPQVPREELPVVVDETPNISTFPHKPIRVLSLFDGIATGLFVLEKMGFKVDVYYSAEINEAAKNVAFMNFGSKIIDLGDVQTVNEKKIAEICPIDLLIGGSPCNDLSFVNPNRKGLFDPEGTGILFFHYFRVLKIIEKYNMGTSRHLFWLFENVNHMPREFKNQISMFLDREPSVIDAKYFSPQSRPRCFWGNIPEMYNPLPPEIYKKVHPLSKYIAKVNNRTTLSDTVNCITTNPNSLKQVFKMNDCADVPWITEIEKIFGFPPHYTDVGNLSIRERQALLGRSWSVGVIEYLLRPLERYYPLRQKKNENLENGTSKKK